MRLQSVRSQLILWNVVVLALVLVLLGFALRFTLQQSLLAGVDAHLVRMAAPVSRQISANGVDHGPGEPGPTPNVPGGPPGPPHGAYQPGATVPPPPTSSPPTQPPGFFGGGFGDDMQRRGQRPAAPGGDDESIDGFDQGPPLPRTNPSSDRANGGPASAGSNKSGPRPNESREHAGQPPGGFGEGNGSAPRPGEPGSEPAPPPRRRRPPPGDYPPRLLRPDGHPYGSSPGDPSGPYDRELFKDSLGGDSRFGQTLYSNALMRIYSAPVYHDGKLIAVIQTEQPLNDVIEGVNELTRILLLISPFALLIAGLSGGLLATHALRPVKQLMRATEQVEATDLSGRIPVVGADEFAELSTTINGMIARLESSFAHQDEAIRQLRRFTADASHELRTPLTVIKANTSLALTGPDDMEAYRLALQEADWAADRMNAIVQDLLLLARSDGGSLEMTLNTVTVASLVEQAVRLVARADTAPIQVRPIAPELKVLADREAIERVLGNLLKNAQRHTPTTGQISIAAVADGSDIVITVSDNGEGIPQQHIAHVFERFYRVDSARTREQGGTGLGLPICKTIVEAHGGVIEIASAIGTQVTVRLPSLASATGRA